MSVYRERYEGKGIDEVSLNDAVMLTGLYGYGDFCDRKKKLLDGEVLLGDEGTYFVREEDE
jgi:hypothetical protein